MLNKNNVHKMIQKIAVAKKAGAFTFEAGRSDAIVNAGMAFGVIFITGTAFVGIKDLAYGTNKKDGF